ncbi:hypothetical protein V2J09_021977 [Rumex salicifolius]
MQYTFTPNKLNRITVQKDFAQLDDKRSKATWKKQKILAVPFCPQLPQSGVLAVKASYSSSSSSIIIEELAENLVRDSTSMGGGLKSSSSFSSSPDDHSSLEDDQSHCSSDDDLGFDQMSNHENSSNQNPFAGNMRREIDQVPKMINSYRSSLVPIESLNEAKKLLLSYSPGSWIDKEEGEKLSDFDVPKTTTLLVVGFKGSGKSSLINRISRLFGDDKLGSNRAQVSSDGSSLEDGTYFLHGYMIPRRSSSFCLFDTRSLSDQVDDNDDLIKSWMTNGVRHGELVIRESDNSNLKDKLACKTRYGSELNEPVRKVNSVIFVVDGLSILRCMHDDNENTRHCRMLARTYNSPYFSFKDDKPAIVVTRGDLLSHEERARVRMYLGKLLAVPPATQTFDIPESSDPVTELASLKMLKYALERADKNLPHRSRECRNLSPTNSSSRQDLKGWIMLLMIGGLALAMLGSQPLIQRHATRPNYLDHLESLVNRTRLLHESLVNHTHDYLDQIQYCNLQKHPAPNTREANPTVNLDLQNSTSQPDPSQHPETRSETEQTVNLNTSSSTTQSDSSQPAADQPTNLKNPQVKSTSSQRKVQAKLCRTPVKHKAWVTKHKPRAHKQRVFVEAEPTISWEARQRLCLQDV